MYHMYVVTLYDMYMSFHIMFSGDKVTYIRTWPSNHCSTYSSVISGYGARLCDSVNDPCSSSPCNYVAACLSITPTDFICQCEQGKQFTGSECLGINIICGLSRLKSNRTPVVKTSFI